jgi:hypothetical protein
VFGANVGTTETGGLVALVGVRVSLTAAALPMIFVGALIKLLGRGRVSDEAIARVDALRRLDALAYHPWRSAAHLVGRSA